MKLLTLTAAFAAAGCIASHAQDQVVRLYEGKAPGSESWTHSEKQSTQNLWNTRVVFNVADPTLTVFKPDPARANGTAVVICPGGAFFALSIESEGNEVARWLVDQGVTCFVLKYRLVECKTDDPLQLAPQSVQIYQDWVKAGKPAELHLYAKGGHGFGMRKQKLPSDRWIQLFADWLEVQGFMTK